MQAEATENIPRSGGSLPARSFITPPCWPCSANADCTNRCPPHRHMPRIRAPTSRRTCFGSGPDAAARTIGHVVHANSGSRDAGIKRVHTAKTCRSPFKLWPWLKKRCGTTRCRRSFALAMAMWSSRRSSSISANVPVPRSDGMQPSRTFSTKTDFHSCSWPNVLSRGPGSPHPAPAPRKRQLGQEAHPRRIACGN
jgi:hypothetical protein